MYASLDITFMGMIFFFSFVKHGQDLNRRYIDQEIRKQNSEQYILFFSTTRGHKHKGKLLFINK